MTQPQRGSTVLLGEFFASGDPRFLDELLALDEPRALAALVERWKRDPRPFARAMQLRYVSGPWPRGHNVVVKRLYKEAERRGDRELLAAFLHRFDLQVRRRRRMRYSWDPELRQAVHAEVLVTPRDGLRGTPPAKARPGLPLPPPWRTRGTLFSVRTRCYLRRRALRQLRRLAFRSAAGSPSEFPAAAAQALALYRDDQLTTGEAILDSFGLLNLCYRRHAALRFTPDHVHLAEGHALSELTPAPAHPRAWQSQSGYRALLWLLPRAGARLVRVWAIAMLRSLHQTALAQIDAAALLPLFEHHDEEVQTFAAQVLAGAAQRDALSPATWLALLGTRSVLAQTIIVDLARPKLLAAMPDLGARVTLACATSAPVAALGVELLRAAPPNDPLPLAELARLRCAALAQDTARWALELLGRDPHYQVDVVVRFFDATLAATRAAAWSYLQPGSRGYDDPALWSRLLETPYADSKQQLVTALRARALPGLDPTDLAPLWSSVLLDIHRGGRTKQHALRQLADAVARDVSLTTKLLPLFAVAVRSSRSAEARVGLAALVQAVEREPALRDAVTQTFPELKFVSAGATA